MDRRNFLRYLSIGAVVGLLGRKLFATEPPQTAPPAHVIYDNDVFDVTDSASTNKSSSPVFMVTCQIDRVGFESTPVKVTANEDGYIELPFDSAIVLDPVRNGRYLVPDGFPIPAVDRFVIYAPLPGYDGPWYRWRSVSRREAKAARNMIAIPKYTISDLAPSLPPSCAGFVQLPNPAVDQTHWAIKSAVSGYTEVFVKCP